MPQDFRRLEAWRRAHAIVLLVYKHTAVFPAHERYGLVAHMRRTATSIPCNVAEGAGRSSDREFAHFLNIAFASATELEYQILLSKDLEYAGDESACAMTAATVESRRTIHGLRQSVLSKGMAITDGS